MRFLARRDVLVENWRVERDVGWLLKKRRVSDEAFIVMLDCQSRYYSVGREVE